MEVSTERSAVLFTFSPAYASGIGAGSDHEIVLELALVSVVDNIHARVHLVVSHLRIRGNADAPSRGIGAVSISYSTTP